MIVEEDCIERHIKQQRSKLYIITGVRKYMDAHIKSIQEYQPPAKSQSQTRAWCEVVLVMLQIDETTEFQPEVRGEIGAFGWHFVTALPASEEAAMQYSTAEGARHHFYQVCLSHTS